VTAEWTAEELWSLAHHWGTVYSFKYDGEVWSAWPASDVTDVMLSADPYELRRQVRRHYDDHPELHERADAEPGIEGVKRA
jgi:hypothetical protein